MTETVQALETAAGVASNDWKPYPTYKPSGLPWLGDMPTNWNTMPNRGFLRRRKTLVGSKHSEYKLLSLTKAGVIVRDISTGKGKFSSDMGTCQEVHPGDLVFCLFDVPETPRTVGLSAHAGMITGAYTIFECDDPLFARYIELFYKAMDDRKLLSPLYSGLRNTIPPPTFLGTKSPVPPPEDQDAIARFLAHYDRLVLKYIQGKQKLITLLTEQKQAIIQHAVTRGLNSDVQLKPSGSDCIGSIPAGWSIMKLRTLLAPWTERNRPELPLLSVVRERGVIIRDVDDMNSNRNFIPEDLRNYKVVHAGQFAMNKMKAWQGSYGVSEHEGIVSPAYFVFELPAHVHGAFFNLAIRSRVYVPLFCRASDGVRVGQWDLSVSAMKEIPLALPPSTEQRAIARAVPPKLEPLDQAINVAKTEIALMREYRTRLTADVVTGKIDVREAAALLPAEMPEEVVEDIELTETADEDVEAMTDA